MELITMQFKDTVITHTYTQNKNNLQKTNKILEKSQV